MTAKLKAAPAAATRADRIEQQRFRVQQVGAICGSLRRIFTHITEGHGPVTDLPQLASDTEIALEAAIALLVDIDQELGEVRS